MGTTTRLLFDNINYALSIQTKIINVSVNEELKIYRPFMIKLMRSSICVVTLVVK